MYNGMGARMWWRNDRRNPELRIPDGSDKPRDFWAYRIGLCAASVCTSIPAAAVAEKMNREHPTGIDSLWELAADPTFGGGEPNPCPCPDSQEHKHYLLSC